MICLAWEAFNCITNRNIAGRLLTLQKHVPYVISLRQTHGGGGGWLGGGSLTDLKLNFIFCLRTDILQARQHQNSLHFVFDIFLIQHWDTATGAPQNLSVFMFSVPLLSSLLLLYSIHSKMEGEKGGERESTPLWASHNSAHNIFSMPKKSLPGTLKQTKNIIAQVLFD